jgi:hypothetical protein
MLNIKILPIGTHEAQIPIGSPRFSGGNQVAMAAGAITERRHIPVPSMTRLKSIIAAFWEKYPMADPKSRAAREVRAVAFKPKRIKINPAGRAKITPTSAKTLISQPDAAIVISKDSINCPIIGGTLN